MGESGSGKSTLARVVAGLQPPDSGEIHYEKELIYKRGMPYSENARRQIQLVFQDPYSSLNPRMKAISAVAEAYRVWNRVNRHEARSKALSLLESMGISQREAIQRPRMLSGGQRQRVNVARALAPAPSLLLADEPTSAIDQSAQARLLNLLRELKATTGLSLLFISHDLSIIRYLTSYVYVMRRGPLWKRVQPNKSLSNLPTTTRDCY